MTRPTRPVPVHLRAFTLVEILVALGIFGIVSTILFAMLQAGSVLLAKNVGINMSNRNARLGTERLLSLVHSAVAAPVLVNSSLGVVAGNGPAAGITFLRLASPSTYTTANGVVATATTLRLHRAVGMPAPQVGDTLIMVGTDSATYVSPNIIGFQASITAVSNVSSTDDTVSFSGSIGGFCDPATTVGNVMVPNSKLFLLTKMACVAVGNDLRLLTNASTPGNFDVMAQLVPIASETQCLPFRYTVVDRRWVDVDLRVETTTYNLRRFSTTNTFFDLKESIAYRSAIIVQHVQ